MQHMTGSQSVHCRQVLRALLEGLTCDTHVTSVTSRAMSLQLRTFFRCNRNKPFRNFYSVDREYRFPDAQLTVSECALGVRLRGATTRVLLSFQNTCFHFRASQPRV